MKVVNIFTNIIIIIVVVDVVAMCSSVPSSVVGINNNNNNDDDNNNNNNDDDNDDSVIILSNIIIASVSNSTASTTRANGSNTHTINTSSDNKNSNNNDNNNNNKAIKNNTPEREKTIEQQSFSTRNCSKFNENPLGSHNNNNNNNNNDCENKAIRKISNDGSISAGTPRRLWHPDDRYFRKIGESEIKRSGISLPPEVPPGILSVRSAGTPKPSRDRQPPVRHRAKRFIIFDGSGVVKLVMGTSFPIKLADPQRSVSISYNLQSQYTPPPVPLYWWSFFNTTAFAARHQRDAPPHHDASRMFAYAIIEQFLESQGIPGGVCLLKAICLVAQQPIHGASVFHAVLNTIFTPSAANIDERYLDAQAAGRYGADCAQTFDKCPHHVNAFKGASFRI